MFEPIHRPAASERADEQGAPGVDPIRATSDRLGPVEPGEAATTRGQGSAGAPRRVLLLDPHVVNQIAAGEVVERPASVVKELVENALDAGARRIEVEVRDAGRARIRVADDGCGMSLEDSQAALQRHATSKIRSLADLGAAATLGFRGEALPSIASVSKMTLTSGLGDGVRWVLVVDSGQAESPRAEGGARGTEVLVEDLFFNTPARLKFMKTDATEIGQIVETLARYAVAHPHVAFRLTNNGSQVLAAPGDGSVRSAILEVWGRDALRSLVELDAWIGGVRVRGFVSPPHATRATRSHQWVYVNGRPVRSKTLMAALDQAYRSLTPERRYPLAILMLDVDPARVDANVSPTKTEVKFAREGEAFDAVRHAVRSALLEQGMIPDAEALARANAALVRARGEASWDAIVQAAQEGHATHLGHVGQDRQGNLDSAVKQVTESCERMLGFSDFSTSVSAAIAEGGALGRAGAFEQSFQGPLGGPEMSGSGWNDPEEAAPTRCAAFRSPHTPPDRPPSSAHASPSASSSDAYASLLNGLRVIGQMDKAFILAVNQQGLIIVDQHVAHERILFEAIRDARSRASIEKQGLLTPVTLHLDKRAAALLAAQVDEVRALGFDVEPFGAGSFLLRGVPAALKTKNPERFLIDLVEELATASGSPAREQIWITCACKAAVKAGDALSIAEMEKLLVDLAQTENPYLCPHGRPITIVLSREGLMRMFKRG